MPLWTTRTAWVAALGALGLVVVCSVAALARVSKSRADDRGIAFSHELHADHLEMDCADCHHFEANRYGLSDTRIANHTVCGVCHTIDEAKPGASCALCHTREDYSVTPVARFLREETIFDHNPHIANEVDCRTCHAAPDKRVLPPGPVMPMCMDCHEQQSPEMAECAVCHAEISRDTKPMFRGSARILHDQPQIWERAHGHEYRIDRQFCAYCHENQEESCETCHRTEKPSSHTIAWNRRTHGLHAGWNRNTCAVCHEEDSCRQCHEHAQPASHRRAGWDSPADRHCVSCHFPQSTNNCTVCHERIDHPRAPRSVHNLGVFPTNCRRCHPGGNVFRAPHPVNATARCTVCHR